MGHFHFSRESKWTWSYKEITTYTSACCYRIRRIATSSAHKCLFTVCKQSDKPDKPLFHWTRKWRDRRKNLIRPLSFFISTSSTASHYLWADRPQTPFHHRRTCKSLANEADIFCTYSLFPSPWLRNSALHSAAFSGKKSVTPLNAINIAFTLLWPGSQLHNCLHEFFAQNARNKGFINLVFYCRYVSSERGKHGNSASSSTWPGTINLWSMELACFIFESTGRRRAHWKLPVELKSCSYWLLTVPTALCLQLEASEVTMNDEFNLLKPCVFFTYHQVLSFNISTLCLFCVVCFVRISEETATFALYSTNWVVFITAVESVYCAVRTDSLYKADYV
jgi:hypothetical protein